MIALFVCALNRVSFTSCTGVYVLAATSAPLWDYSEVATLCRGVLLVYMKRRGPSLLHGALT